MLSGKNIGVVIPAAGSGTRMGGNRSKQYLALEGIPVYLHSVIVCQRSGIIDSIVLVARKKDIPKIERDLKFHACSKVVGIVPGGKERQDSVWNGLKEIRKYGADVVLVHDAVRPFITGTMIRAITNAAIRHGGAIVAVCSKDTLKMSDKKGSVSLTLPRERLWSVQTPQAFQINILSDAFKKAKKAGFLGTDDASLVERIGKKIKIVKGSYENIKITTPEDLEFAKLIARRSKYKHRVS